MAREICRGKSHGCPGARAGRRAREERRARRDARDDERCERRVRRGACEARAIRRARRFARDDEVHERVMNFAPTIAADDADAAEFAERASTSAPGSPAPVRPDGHLEDLPLQILWETTVRATPRALTAFAGYYRPGCSCTPEAPRSFCEIHAHPVFTDPALSPPVHLL